MSNNPARPDPAPLPGQALDAAETADCLPMAHAHAFLSNVPKRPANKILPVDVGTRGAAGEGRLGIHGEERRYEHSLLTIFTSWIRSADDGEPARVYAGRASQRRQEPLGGGGCQRRREG